MDTVVDSDYEVLFEGLESFERDYPISMLKEHVYCIYCQASKQALIAQQISKFFDYKAFNPTIIRRLWKEHRFIEKTYSLLPGYIFLYSPCAIEPFLVRRLDGVDKVLQYDNGSYALSDEDEKIARWFLRYDGTIGLSYAIRVGDWIDVIHGPLADYSGEIIKIDMKRKRAKIKLQFGKNVVLSWLDYEIITVAQ